MSKESLATKNTRTSRLVWRHVCSTRHAAPKLKIRAACSASKTATADRPVCARGASYPRGGWSDWTSGRPPHDVTRESLDCSKRVRTRMPPRPNLAEPLSGHSSDTLEFAPEPPVPGGEAADGGSWKGAGMPSGRDLNGGRRGGGTTKKNAFCSFCRKSYRDVGPLVEGPGDVYICGECIELCQSILDQERRRRGTGKQLFTNIPTPREIVDAARRVRHRPGARQEGPLRRRPQPLQAADAGGRRRLGRRDRQVEHPADRPDRLAARRCWPARWPAS